MNTVGELLQSEWQHYQSVSHGEKVDNSELAKSLLIDTDPNAVLLHLLLMAMLLTNADGGTLYWRTNSHLQIHTLLNRSLNLNLHPNDALSEPRLIPLYSPSGKPNRQFLSAQTALDRHAIHIPDVDAENATPLKATGGFDKMYGYKTKSILTIPIQTAERVLGVIQLVNALNARSEIVPFSEHDARSIEKLCGALAASSAVRGFRTDFLDEMPSKNEKPIKTHHVALTLATIIIVIVALAKILF